MQVAQRKLLLVRDSPSSSVRAPQQQGEHSKPNISSNSKANSNMLKFESGVYGNVIKSACISLHSHIHGGLERQNIVFKCEIIRWCTTHTKREFLMSCYFSLRFINRQNGRVSYESHIVILLLIKYVLAPPALFPKYGVWRREHSQKTSVYYFVTPWQSHWPLCIFQPQSGHYIIASK